MAFAEVVAALRMDTGQFTAAVGEAKAQVDGLSKSGASSMEKMAAVGKVAFLALGAAAVGVGVISVTMGEKLMSAQAQLANAFKNAHEPLSEFKGQIDKLDQSFIKYGYSSATTQGALAQLVTITGNAQESINVMGLAADIAANRHMDLNTASTLLAKTMGGNLTAVKRMGIEIPAAVTKIKDPTEKANAVLAILEGRFKGSAAAAAGTFSGKIAALKAQGETLFETIGLHLIPILEKLASQALQVVQWFEKHKAIAEALGIMVGVFLVAAIAAYIVAMGVAAVETIAATWEILAIIVAVGLLVYGVLWLSDNWNRVWKDVKQWASDAITWLEQHIPGLTWLIDAAKVEIQVFGWIWGAVWGAISSVISAAWDGISSVLDQMYQGIQNILNPLQTLKNLWDSVFGGGASGTVGGVTPAMQSYLNSHPGTSFPGHAAGTGMGTFSGMTWVGEDGPELVNFGPPVQILSNRQSAAVGGQVTNYFSVTISNQDPQGTVNALRQWIQRNGSLAGAGVA